MLRHAAVLLCLCIAGSALAQVPAVDPPGRYRLIGPTGRSDSRCIGSPDTPLCAVETLLACFARRDESLCRAVWHPPRPDIPLFAGASRPGYWWSYRIAAAEQVASDEVVIAVAGRNCGLLLTPPDCVTTPAAPTGYRLRRQPGGGWRVIDWQAPPGRPDSLH